MTYPPPYIHLVPRSWSRRGSSAFVFRPSVRPSVAYCYLLYVPGRGNAVESAGGTGSACGPPQRAFAAFIRHATTVVLTGTTRATTSPAHVADTADDGSGTDRFSSSAKIVLVPDSYLFSFLSFARTSCCKHCGKSFLSYNITVIILIITITIQ